MSDRPQMFDLSSFVIGSLKDTPPGGLFLPVVQGGRRFIAGRLNEFPVLVVLEDDNGAPFRVASPEQWSVKAGLHVVGGRIQVDPLSAAPIRDPRDAPHGAIVLSARGLMIIAHDQNGTKAALLEGGADSTEIGENAVAFTTWRYVVGGEAHPVALFEFRAQ